MIFKLKLGKIPKLLTKLQNGILMDVQHHQFHHGNISFLVEVLEAFSKEVIELEANTSMILGFWMLTTSTGFQLKWNKMNKNYPQPENLLLHSTMQMIKDFTYSVVGLMNGLTICGCYQLEILQDHLMLLIILNQKSDL